MPTEQVRWDGRRDRMILYACTAIACTSYVPQRLNVDKAYTEMQRLRAAGVGHFILDLSQDLHLENSTMLGSLMPLLKAAHENGGNIAIVGSPRVCRLFEITGLRQMFPVYHQLAEALAGINWSEEVTTDSSEVFGLLGDRPGLSDREIADILLGPGEAQQSVNGMCRRLASKGVIERRRRPDGIIGNYLTDGGSPDFPSQAVESECHRSNSPEEDEVQKTLAAYLGSLGWTIQRLAHGKSHGVDIEAERGGERWLIEVKGIGSRPEMRHNYFLNVLGQILGRMTDPAAKYSVAFPDTPQFRQLWSRLPAEAKSRTQITALFVSEDGVEESA